MGYLEKNCWSHKDYVTPSEFVQVSMIMTFTNTTLRLDTIAIVKPAAAMPNNFNGIILGQRGAIECMIAKSVPRNFLAHLSAEFWGEIHVSQTYGVVTKEITHH